MGGAIPVEASLSFLGLGVPPPVPSWGRRLSLEGMRYFVGANLFGDALRDVLDPKFRGRSATDPGRGEARWGAWPHAR